MQPDHRPGSEQIRCGQCNESFNRTAWRTHTHNPDRASCEAQRCQRLTAGYIISDGTLLCGEHLLENWRNDREVRLVDGTRCRVCYGYGQVPSEGGGAGERWVEWVRCPHCQGSGYDADLRQRTRRPARGTQPTPPPVEGVVAPTIPPEPRRPAPELEKLIASVEAQPRKDRPQPAEARGPAQTPSLARTRSGSSTPRRTGVNTARLTRRVARLTRRIVSTLVVIVLVAYVVAVGIHLSNGFEVGHALGAGLRDARLAMECPDKPGRVWEWVDRNILIDQGFLIFQSLSPDPYAEICNAEVLDSTGRWLNPWN